MLTETTWKFNLFFQNVKVRLVCTGGSVTTSRDSKLNHVIVPYVLPMT